MSLLVWWIRVALYVSIEWSNQLKIWKCLHTIWHARGLYYIFWSKKQMLRLQKSENVDHSIGNFKGCKTWNTFVHLGVEAYRPFFYSFYCVSNYYHAFLFNSPSCCNIKLMDTKVNVTRKQCVMNMCMKSWYDSDNIWSNDEIGPSAMLSRTDVSIIDQNIIML